MNLISQKLDLFLVEFLTCKEYSKGVLSREKLPNTNDFFVILATATKRSKRITKIRETVALVSRITLLIPTIHLAISWLIEPARHSVLPLSHSVYDFKSATPNVRFQLFDSNCWHTTLSNEITRFIKTEKIQANRMLAEFAQTKRSEKKFAKISRELDEDRQKRS